MQGEQLTIGFPEPERLIGDTLRRFAGMPLHIVFTDNSSSMISYRTTVKQTVVRMHRMFLAADEQVLADIAAFIKNRSAATPALRGFICSHGHLVRPARQHSRTVVSSGRVYDLSAIFAKLNARYFSGALLSAITWSRRSPRSGVRRRNLGSYDRKRELIRISRYLDRKSVPRYYVEYVVYHEMLHEAVGVQQNNGRCLIHTAEFRRREKLFRDYDLAMAWEKGSR